MEFPGLKNILHKSAHNRFGSPPVQSVGQKIRTMSLTVQGLALAVCLVINAETATSDPMPKGNRSLSIAITLGKDGSFEAALKKAEATGMDRRSEMQINWNEIETAAETYTYDVVNIARKYFLIPDTPIILTLSPLYNLEDGRPQDLRGLPFNHPKVVSRFNKMTSWVFGELERAGIDVDLFVFGNEFDLFLGVEYAIKAGSFELWQQKWGEITDLYEQSIAHVKSISPGVMVTTEITFDSLIGNARVFAHRMNQKSNVIGVSHYLKNSSTDLHEPPESVSSYFAQLVNAYPEKPIYFLQYGYSSKSSVGSSTEKQRQFIVNTFEAWDSYRDSFPYICFTWLHELHPDVAHAMISKFGAADEKAMGFFGGIGLLNYDSTPKPAFKELIRQARLRGW